MKAHPNSPKEAQASVVSAVSAINLSLASLRDQIEVAKADYAALDGTAPDDQTISARVSATIKCLVDEARALLPLEFAAANGQEFSAHAAASALTRAGSAQFTPAPNGMGHFSAARLSGVHFAALFQPEVVAGLMIEAAQADIRASGAKQATAAHVERERTRLTKEIESLGVQEESWLRHAESVGIALDRRPDADPAFVLMDDEALNKAAALH